jgi:hypothetical protein
MIASGFDSKGWIAVAAALLLACAEERPAVDRVQTFALDKAFFVGQDFEDPADNPEFWAQATLVDVSFGATHESLFTSTYAQPVSRIKWFITEDLLVARLAYERIPGTDGKGVGERTDEGVIVAAFAIEKHFDIVNDYNPTTGEELNVVEENDTDRPWNERQYMRVDFSKNLNVDSYDLDTLSQLGIFDGIEYEPLGYYVDDPKHPDAPVFDTGNGYFDITVKAFAKPMVINIASFGWGIDSFPACWLDYDFLQGSYPAGGCSPAELTIRHAFRKVVDLDFEPIDWDGERFQAYGGFYVERFGYNRLYGMSDKHWHRFLTHYQLYEREHYYDNPETLGGPVECYTAETTPYGADPHRDEDADGTEDECAKVGGGSRCDIFRQRCTLPFSQRKTTVIPWYYTEESDPEYWEPTELATHQWDVALRHAVTTARYGECIKLGGADCAEKFPVLNGQWDDQEDALALALEVDDCRNGLAYGEKGKDPKKCADLAAEIASVRGYSPEAVALASMDELVVLCHSPVRAGDHPACGDKRLPAGVTEEDCDAAEEEFDATDAPSGELQQKVDACKAALRVRRGDMRYHQINTIEEPQLAMPWGIYVDSEDPTNGQKIATSVNLWSAVTDEWSQKVVDMLRYSAGELTAAEVTEADYVADYAQAVEAASVGGAFPRLTAKELDRRLSQFVGLAAGAREKARNFAAQYPDVIAKAREQAQAFRSVRASNKVGSTWAPIYAARRQAAMGSEVEATLMNREIQQLYGVEGLPISEPLMEMVSPLRGGNPSIRRNMRDLRARAIAAQGGCVMEAAQAPTDLGALAGVLQQKFGAFNPADSKDVQVERAERMRKYVAKKVHFSAIVHEMGHSIGMRHNFIGSADAWFYKPQYWQLRTSNGTVLEPCEGLSQTGEDCVGPRFFDPVSKAERDNLINMFTLSSVMDYPGEATQDFNGLGVYDFAAARMFYGDVVAVHANASYNVGTPRGTTVIDKLDDFGGILGISHWFGDNEIHYSNLQEHFDLISDCREVNPQPFMPARYDAERDGIWNPLADAGIVAIDGKYSRCRQQPVDYVPWTALTQPSSDQYDGWNGGLKAVDAQGRTRVPYGFATDSWVDLGNASVYTHDAGADVFEIFNFLATQQEIMHIFDNYRRGRQDFSVRSAAERSMWRYNEKLRDGAKGLTLIRNWMEDYAAEEGMEPKGFWAAIAPSWYRDNVIASGMVFDHFAHLAARPEAGPHFAGKTASLLVSAAEAAGEPGQTQVTVPNGVIGKFGNVIPAGRLVENRYAQGMGEYNYDMITNAGSYYDKINTAMLLTESVDNFISDSRPDFVDSRYRAVSIADLFPEGYRRFLGNMLTGEEFLKGPRIAASSGGKALVDADGFPSQGIGWTTWWGEQPESCFPAEGGVICDVWGASDIWIPSDVPANVVVLDPQVGWEEQKFFIAWTLLYLPENEQQEWLDQLRLWELGKDADPGIANRIELHHPAGKTYIARTYGKESIFGRTVQKGIAARILEYANGLVAKAYVTEDGPDLDGDKKPDWYLPKFNPKTGEPLVRYDPTVQGVQGEYIFPEGTDICNDHENSGCVCGNNRACTTLESYLEIPFFLRQTLDAYNLMDPEPEGIW